MPTITQTPDLHTVLEEVESQLKAMAGNAAEAFITQVGHKAKAWQALAPVFDGQRSAWAAKNAGKAYTAAQFTKDLVKLATDAGETWEHDENQTRGLMAFAVHTEKAEAGYRTWCAGARVVAHIDGYTDHLIGLQDGKRTITGKETKAVTDRKAENAAKRLAAARKAADKIKFDTFFGPTDGAKRKLEICRDVRRALDLQISELEAEVKAEREAAKAAEKANA